ncbi:MAG: hypothetical protein UR31_C0013G0038 [Parcubacteria group bacterium GW2011_GWA2_33_14]|nr:MAG: hypothetical protein UR31_C0013G0038 [Parcubacteria group bacterium GW2011_GWA2_33_14]
MINHTTKVVVLKINIKYIIEITNVIYIINRAVGILKCVLLFLPYS